MRTKNWMLGGILVTIAVLGPMVAYAGVSVIYPGSAQSVNTNTTPPITFAAGGDYTLADTLGFADAFTQTNSASSFTITLSGLAGGTVTIDDYVAGTATANVGTWKVQVASALTGTLTTPTTLKIRLWDPAGAAPTADNSASVCAVLSLLDAADTESSTACSDDVKIQVIYQLPSGASGTSSVSIRPSSVTFA